MASAHAQTDALWRAASRLAARGGGRKGGRRLPPLLFFTDPARTPEPVAVAARLPRGAGVVFRHFGAEDAGEVAAALAGVARRRGLTLLIGGDEALAAAVGAAGVHLPQRGATAARLIRLRRPGWIITVAAHDGRALARAVDVGVDAAVLSPVLESRSASAGRPLGPVRFAALVRGAGLPIYALGGVGAITAARLADTGAHGLAAIDALTR